MRDYVPADIPIPENLSLFKAGTEVQLSNHTFSLPRVYSGLIMLLKPVLTGTPAETFEFEDFLSAMDIEAKRGVSRSGKIRCWKLEGPIEEIAGFIPLLQFSGSDAVTYILRGVWTLKDAAEIEEAIRTATFPQVRILRALSYVETVYKLEVTIIFWG